MDNLGRVELMNASPTHSKVRVKLALSAPVYVAGDEIKGKMELESRADKGLALGKIFVQLVGSQELTSRDHAALSTFLNCRRDFQGPGLPPSNAVHPFPPQNGKMEEHNPLPTNYYPARKGITTFFYQLPLPPSTPSSIDFNNGLARIKYTVRASVEVIYRGESKIVTGVIEANVVEAVPLDLPPQIRTVVLGDGGKLWAEGTINGGYSIAGTQTMLQMYVKNHTLKSTTGYSLSIVRRLHLAGEDGSDKKVPPKLEDTLLNVPYRGGAYVIQPASEGIANLVFEIPINARGVNGAERMDLEGKKTNALFELACVVVVRIHVSGFTSKDTVLEIPIRIVHPSAAPQFEEPYPAPLPHHHIQPPHHALPPPQSPYYLPHHHHSASPNYYEPHSPIFHPHSPANVYSPSPWANVRNTPSPTSATYFPPYDQHNIPPQSQAQPGVIGAIYNHPYWPEQQQPSPPTYDHHARMTPPNSNQGYTYYSPPQPQPHYYVSPIRPASTEPADHSGVGIALFATPPPVAPSQAAEAAAAIASPSPPPEDPNKGPQSRRISHHLRYTSQARGRSVSPPASRSEILFPLPLGPAQPPSVLSPRPMISPRQSYEEVSVERGERTSGGALSVSVRSERVAELERMAADEEREKELELQELQKEMDKTLPAVLVPSKLSSRPQMGNLKEEEEDIRELIKKEGISPGRGGGLDALEKRLLADVGTRKFPLSLGMPVLPLPKFVTDRLGVAPSNDRKSGSTLKPPPATETKTSTGTPPSLAKAFDGSASAPVLFASKDVPPSVASSSKEQHKGGRMEKEGEIRQLRREAKGRVNNWIAEVEAEAESEVYEQIDTPTKPPKPKPQPQIEIEKTIAIARPEQELAPESPRSKPVRTNLKLDWRTKLDIPPLSPTKYDIHKSARGGKGGIVTAVTSIWAQQTENRNQNQDQQVRTGDDTSKAKTTPSPPNKRPRPVAKFSPPLLLSAPNSTSAADNKLSSKMASPVLSSTASLARPPKQFNSPGGRMAMAPVLAPVVESDSTTPISTPTKGLNNTPASTYLPVGRAKLRDLISKYEGGAGGGGGSPMSSK